METRKKKNRKSFFSWILNTPEEETMERDYMNKSYSSPTTTTDIEIPNRRQSHLYTPYHTTEVKPTQVNPDINKSSSSLTRSATWQPSTDHIPDRRTSRNYAANPEIQAKLNAMLNSDKALYLSTVLQQQQNNQTSIQRRSTTPSNT